MAFRKRLQAVHVPHHKNTAGMKAETLPPPKEVLLPMNMHMGTPAVPVVSVGDYVRVGQKLARGEGSITCEVHATVSGTVLSLDPMPELFGNDLPVIRIENDGKMEADPTLAPRTAEDLAAFVEDLHESGIVGLGGAAFPVDWKFDAALRHNVKTMLINGAECEPYVTSDNRMMLDHGEDIRRGIELLKKYVKPDNFVFAIENNKPHAIAAMKELFADDPTMSIVELPSSYPQGAKQMILITRSARSFTPVSVLQRSALSSSTSRRLPRSPSSWIPACRSSTASSPLTARPSRSRRTCSSRSARRTATWSRPPGGSNASRAVL